MKHLLLIILVLVSFTHGTIAQCTVKNIIVKVNSAVPSGTSCVLNFDFTFTIENNGGNKYIYIHSWLQSEYANVFGCPNMSGNLKAPLAADLVRSRINLGIHNDIHAGHPVPTLLTQYEPDPSVPLTTSDELIRQVYPTGDSARFTIKGVEVTMPMACGQVVFMTADFWSTQAQNSNIVHCVSCNNNYVIDPRVFGVVNCSNPRTYNLIIRSAAPTIIGGNYRIYLDNPIDGDIIGSFGPEDTLVSAGNYQTTLGIYNEFVATNQPYLPYSYHIPDADRNLWALVETNQYANKVLGYLVNACAPLPLNITSFNVSYHNRQVDLDWSVIGDETVAYYEVNRKVDKQSFTPIGLIPANQDISAGTSARYHFTDRNLPAGQTILYRIASLTKTGERKFSDIKMIQLSPSAEITVYPNPVKNSLFVSVPVSMGTADVELVDLSGRIISQWNNVAQQNIHLNKIIPGMYMLRFYPRNGADKQLKKIIVDQ